MSNFRSLDKGVEKMARKEELLKIFDSVDNKELVIPLIDEAVELENKIMEFRKELNKTTPSSSTIKKYKFYHSCYKEYVNLYTQVIKSLMTFIGKGEEETSSPLRDYFKKVQGLND